MKDQEIIKLAKNTIELEAKGLLNLVDLIDNNFLHASRLLLECKGHVLVSGSGTSHAVARRLAHLLSVCGTPSLLLDAGDSPHGLSGAITKNDVVIAISKGGTTRDVYFLASVAKKRGAELIAITEKTESPLGKIADIVLGFNSPVEGDPFGMIATGSSLMSCALGDALCVVLLKIRNYTIEQFGENHPGGAVGKKLNEMEII